MKKVIENMVHNWRRHTISRFWGLERNDCLEKETMGKIYMLSVINL